MNPLLHFTFSSLHGEAAIHAHHQEFNDAPFKTFLTIIQKKKKRKKESGHKV